MSPNPVTAAAAWTFALVVDVVAVGVAGVALLWNRHCPAGVAMCPTPAELAGRDELALVLLAVVIGVVALYALVRGRLLLFLVQVALGAVLGLAAHTLAPDGFDAVRHDVHLAHGATELRDNST